MKVGFIGLGNMASAIIGAVIKKGMLKPSEIIGSDSYTQAVRNAERRYGIETTSDNKIVAREADMILLAVKPQYYGDVIADIKNEVTKDKVIITIAPGKTLEWIKEQFGKDVKVVRCMPNTPALVLEGCTGVCPGESVTQEELNEVLKLLGSFSKVTIVPESLMDVVVGVSGSLPAYVFMLIEAVADAAVAEGMPRTMAYGLISQAVLGSAKMVLELNKHPGELKDMVCSPGGTTIQAVRVLEERGMRPAVMEATLTCIEKSKSL